MRLWRAEELLTKDTAPRDRAEVQFRNVHSKKKGGAESEEGIS